MTRGEKDRQERILKWRGTVGFGRTSLPAMVSWRFMEAGKQKLRLFLWSVILLQVAWILYVWTFRCLFFFHLSELLSRNDHPLFLFSGCASNQMNMFWSSTNSPSIKLSFFDEFFQFLPPPPRPEHCGQSNYGLETLIWISKCVYTHVSVYIFISALTQIKTF